MRQALLALLALPIAPAAFAVQPCVTGTPLPAAGLASHHPIVGNKACALYARDRIALCWPALGLGRFVRIAPTPDLIQQMLGRVAGKP